MMMMIFNSKVDGFGEVWVRYFVYTALGWQSVAFGQRTYTKDVDQF